MMRNIARSIASTVFAAGFLLNSVTNTFADDPAAAGVVRISDLSAQQIQQVSHLRLFRHGLFHRHRGMSGYGCSHGCGYGHHGHFGHFLHADRGPLSNMLTPDNSCTFSPGHGWAAPAPHPIQENPVEYQRYWPTKWYGQPGGGVSAAAHRYPTIYMPTDTTQLGYYYQRVPQWQPNPGMMPPPPWPPYWHARQCPVDGCHQVTIGKIGDRRHYGPMDQQYSPAPHTEQPQEDNPVPPAPKADGDKSAANLQLVPALD